MKKIIAAFLFFFFIHLVYAQESPVGHWEKDASGMPLFNYTGALPYHFNLDNGQVVKLPADPWFLLGNYRMTLFVHVSGEYELITGQRAWGRMNQGSSPNSGLNASSIDIVDKREKVIKTFQLTGLRSMAADPAACKRVFGCGYAQYTYTVNQVTCIRTLSVRPSKDPHTGLSAFLLTVKLTNNTGKRIDLTYNEQIGSHYESMQEQHTANGNKRVKYVNAIGFSSDRRTIKADIKGITADPMEFPDRTSISRFDGYPPCLFIHALSPDTRLTNAHNGDTDTLSSKTSLSLGPHQSGTIRMVIGYSFKSDFMAIDTICDSMRVASDPISPGAGILQPAGYSKEWLKVLPSFPKEKDTLLKNELMWHAYNLEAMAKYNQFYNETEIPQGTIYDYDWGIHASARDHMQHALACIYYNPRLARSALKYIMKKTTQWGEIRLMESGYGFAYAGSYFTSDQQLFFFQLLSEYLRVTGDFSFLNEEISCYPLKNIPGITVLQVVENCFRFLRDEIGTGKHGLVRLMNSDWNDAVYYIVKAPYNRVLYDGESHMNSAMVSVILGKLIPQLESLDSIPSFSGHSTQIHLLAKSMSLYRDQVDSAFMRDLGERTFSRRMYFNGKAYGDDNLFLEPQGYMMQMKELGTERKKDLLNALKERVYKGEKLGAREQEAPEFEDEEFDKGSRENGGFWYALNGPVINGVAMFDKPEALRLLKKMSFTNYSACFPHFWSSYWSASDNVESSLIPAEGLPDQSAEYSAMPVYCAHPHSWILYCYYKIME